MFLRACSWVCPLMCLLTGGLVYHLFWVFDCSRCVCVNCVGFHEFFGIAFADYLVASSKTAVDDSCRLSSGHYFFPLIRAISALRRFLSLGFWK